MRGKGYPKGAVVEDTSERYWWVPAAIVLVMFLSVLTVLIYVHYKQSSAPVVLDAEGVVVQKIELQRLVLVKLDNGDYYTIGSSGSGELLRPGDQVRINLRREGSVSYQKWERK